MIKRVRFRNRLGYPMDMVLDVIEEDRKYIYAKGLENGNPYLISRKSIDEILEAKVEVSHEVKKS